MQFSTIQLYPWGGKRGLRGAVVLRVNRNRDFYPLFVDTNEVISQWSMIRKVPKEGDDEKTRYWRKVHTYELVDGKSNSSTRAKVFNAAIRNVVSNVLTSRATSAQVDAASSPNTDRSRVDNDSAIREAGDVADVAVRVREGSSKQSAAAADDTGERQKKLQQFVALPKDRDRWKRQKRANPKNTGGWKRRSKKRGHQKQCKLSRDFKHVRHADDADSISCLLCNNDCGANGIFGKASGKDPADSIGVPVQVGLAAAADEDGKHNTPDNSAASKVEDLWDDKCGVVGSAKSARLPDPTSQQCPDDRLTKGVLR
ncbi:unnamed protein product [Phytophthora lilii]|uniref:Unnamed protein product n=1 Tax=Phytophthora lilii TaxID=2077276 RepID=A0A9W6TDX8_9STRA|nr:unnamed protein product [Phytophthora lilii]